MLKFQSTLPAWGATRQAVRDSFHRRISIHAPRVGSDLCNLAVDVVDFDFNPRSPRGERPSAFPRVEIRAVISIHAPRVGSDQAMPRKNSA